MNFEGIKTGIKFIMTVIIGAVVGGIIVGVITNLALSVTCVPKHGYGCVGYLAIGVYSGALIGGVIGLGCGINELFKAKARRFDDEAEYGKRKNDEKAKLS